MVGWVCVSVGQLVCGSVINMWDGPYLLSIFIGRWWVGWLVGVSVGRSVVNVLAG